MSPYTLIAFHNDPTLKQFVLDQLAAHREADKLVKSRYWENGKGCAVGCTLEAVRLRYSKFEDGISHESHALYESELGIPRIIALLEDKLFELLPNSESQAWPERFTAAIRPGADLTTVWPRFAHWMLAEEIPPRTKDQRALASLAAVAALYREWVAGAKPSVERWRIAQGAADEVASDAAEAAETADTGSDADNANADLNAADTAASYASYAADGDEHFAYAAASSYADVPEHSHKRQADKLIELLQAAPVKGAA